MKKNKILEIFKFQMKNNGGEISLSVIFFGFALYGIIETSEPLGY